MNRAQMEKAFNEWMRRYIDEPDRFEREFRSVNDFLSDQAGGREPTYGETCASYMEQIATACP